MRRHPLGSLKCFALTALFLCIVPYASATNLVFDTAGNIVGNYVGARSVAADWVYSGGRAGAAASTAGTFAVNAAKVPVTAVAVFDAAAVAGIASKVVLAGNVLGAGFFAYQTYQAVKNSGILACKTVQSFYCVTPKTEDKKYIGPWSTVYFPTMQEAADDQCRQEFANTGGRTATSFIEPADTKANNGIGQWYYSCLDGGGKEIGGSSLTARSTGTSSGTGPERAASDGEVTQSVTDKANSDHEYGRQVMEAMRADSAAHPAIVPPQLLAPPSTPVVVTAKPVTGDQQTVSTTTSTNPDGSTSTTVKKNVETVTPVTSGNTLGDSNTVFNITNTTTTSVTNNSTGVTTTETTVTNTAGQPTNQVGQEPDTGPRECGSPGHPKCAIDETGTPTPPDVPIARSAADTALAKTASDAITAIQQIPDTSRNVSWQFGFNLPSGCSAFPMYLGIVVDYCKFQPVIHDLMSMVWYAATLFALLGMFGRVARGNS